MDGPGFASRGGGGFARQRVAVRAYALHPAGPQERPSRFGSHRKGAGPPHPIREGPDGGLVYSLSLLDGFRGQPSTALPHIERLVGERVSERGW